MEIGMSDEDKGQYLQDVLASIYRLIENVPSSEFSDVDAFFLRVINGRLGEYVAELNGREHSEAAE
jgi:hypothetical protein